MVSASNSKLFLRQKKRRLNKSRLSKILE
jgi:hypothetical protein